MCFLGSHVLVIFVYKTLRDLSNGAVYENIHQCLTNLGISVSEPPIYDPGPGARPWFPGPWP